MSDLNLTLKVWRQADAESPGGRCTLRGRRRLRRHVVPRDARRPQRGPRTRAGEEPDRLRPRLPRGHLRHVRPDDQRRGPRARGAPRPASCTCGRFKDGDDDHDRAVARRRLPGHQGPGRRPQRRSTGSSRPAASSRSTPALRPTPTPIPVPKEDADRAFDAAACIGCGACVAACPNASASLFIGAKITHLGELPQGQAERDQRVVNMVGQQDHEGFGGCTNIGECTAACPKEIPLDVISRLNWDLHAAMRHGL